MSTFVAVHGGWFGGWVWDDVAELVEEQGYPTAVVDQLPSVGNDPSGLGDLITDTEHVRRHIEAIDGTVILAGHSSGGMVVTELADHPAVQHSIYVTAFWPEAGQSVLDMAGEELPDWMTARADGTVAVSPDLETVREGLFADIDRDRAADVHRRLQLTAIAALQAPSTAPPRTHPTTFVICDQDRSIPPPAQEAMAAKADHVDRLPSSHCPMLAMPKELAGILVRILDGEE